MRRAFAVAITFLSATPALAQSRPTAAATKEDGNKAAIKMSLGVDYSNGKYGDTQSTKVLSTPFALRYAKGPLAIKISVPFVNVRGPGSLLTTPEDRGGRQARGGNSGGGSSNSGPGSSNSGSGSSSSGSGSSNSGSGSSNSGSGSSGGGSSGNSGSGSSGSGGGSSSTSGSATTNLSAGTIIPGGVNRNQSGIGDVNVSLTYSFDFGNDLFLDVMGKAKLPTASKSKRLGTGKADFIASLELSKAFGKVDVYAGGRRRFSGNPAGRSLRDTWGISTGLGLTVAKGTRIGLDYDWQQASFAGGRGSSEVTGSVNLKLNSRTNLNLYATTGLNSASTDLGVGAQIGYRF